MKVTIELNKDEMKAETEFITKAMTILPGVCADDLMNVIKDMTKSSETHTMMTFPFGTFYQKGGHVKLTVKPEFVKDTYNVAFETILKAVITYHKNEKMFKRLGKFIFRAFRKMVRVFEKEIYSEPIDNPSSLLFAHEIYETKWFHQEPVVVNLNEKETAV